MELCRLGDKLHLDGMDTLPVMQAKKKVIRTVLPGMRLDGKGNAYINAAFDIAKGKVDGRQDRERSASAGVQCGFRKCGDPQCERQK